MHGAGADEWEVRGNAAICFLTLGILSGATSLSLFGGARVVWWRERERGVRSLSYFLAATCTQAVGGWPRPPGQGMSASSGQHFSLDAVLGPAEANCQRCKAPLPLLLRPPPCTALLCWAPGVQMWRCSRRCSCLSTPP